MLFLVLSVIFSVLSPIIYKLALYYNRTWNVIERVLMVLIGALVTFHLLPESISLIGNFATFLAFVGLFLPSLLERLLASYASQIHVIAVTLGAAGLFVHGIIDGAAMSLPHVISSRDVLLPLTVLLHRLPSGMLLCGLFHKKHGWGFVWGLLFLSIIGTILGFNIGSWVFKQGYGMYVIAHFQAVVSGSILHIALDTHESGFSHKHSHK